MSAMLAADVLFRWDGDSFALTGWGWVIVIALLVCLWELVDRDR